MTIPVVFSTDQNYLFYTAVAISSLAINAREETFYQIYILRDEVVFDGDGILKELQNRFTNIAIREIVVDKAVFQKVVIHNSHISKASFYRLMIADMIPLDKCIYMDADTLAEGDLSQLWNTDLSEYYIAGCRDIWIDWMEDEEREERRRKTGIPSMDTYVNAGILLLNLKKIREDKINLEFQSHLSYDYAFEDQDILNVCCYGHIMLLPEKWNRFNEVYGSGEQMKKKHISILPFLEKDGMVHFTNKAGRPWETFKSWKSLEWWDVADCLEHTTPYRKLRRIVEHKDNIRSFSALCEVIMSYEKIIIWGYTVRNEYLRQWIENSFSNVEISFADRDGNKQQRGSGNVRVLSPDEAYREKKNCLFIVTSKRWKDDIYKELLANGIEQNDIYIYEDKGIEYYRMLDERYYDVELQEICKKEAVEDGTIRSEWKEKYFLDSWLWKERQNAALGI